MAIGRVRYLEDDEKVNMEKWANYLPQYLQEKYIFYRRPFVINKVDDYWEGVLSIPLGEGLPYNWREKCEELIINMQLEGVTVLVSPKEGEFPQDILPFARGKKLMGVLTFFHMEEILERVAENNENENIKNIETTNFVIAGGNAHDIGTLTYFMPLEVNNLAFFHSNLDEMEELQEYFFANRGLPTEMFASPKNPVLSNADVVFLCDNSILAYEHILKKNCVFIDIIGNKIVTKKIVETRPDVTVIDGFLYERNEQVYTYEEWEARIYNRHRKVRKYLTGQENADRDILFYIKNLNLELKELLVFGDIVT